MISFNILIFVCLNNFIPFCLCKETQIKSFGGMGPFEDVDEVESYPETEKFFQDYVESNKPLKIRGAAMASPAFRLWTDDYFMSMSELNEENVMLEEGKVEDRNKANLEITFLEFLRIYNDSDNYLVTQLPLPLRQDLYLPSPLQCPHIYKNLLLENVMWMSSGDTSSVVHQDSVENIICLLRGRKKFVFIDPNKYGDQVVMEHEEEGYSDINVSHVDYNKYDGLLSVKYQQVHLNPGDCLYIPFNWIHQVTSLDSNLAVNVWWDPLRSLLHLPSCHRNPSATFSDGVFRGLYAKSGKAYRSEILNLLGGQDDHLNLKQFYKTFLMEGEKVADLSEKESIYLEKMFVLCDSNHNGLVEDNEIKGLAEEEWEAIEVNYKLLEEETLRRTSTNSAGASRDEL